MIDEVFGVMKVVQVFGQESCEVGCFVGVVENVFGIVRCRIVLCVVMMVIVILFVFLLIMVVIWQGVLDVKVGNIIGGMIVVFVLYGGFVVGLFGVLVEVYGDLLCGVGVVGWLGELFNEQLGIVVFVNFVLMFEFVQGWVIFDYVVFCYLICQDVSVLIDFIFDIQFGEIVVVVGFFGVGKMILF